MIKLINKDLRTPIVAVRKLIGKKLTVSFSENKTVELWKSFMSCRDKIKNKLNSDLFSVQVYPPGFFENFRPRNEFEKFVGMEVSDFDSVPEGMETFELPAGLYVLFEYKGNASEAVETFGYIYYDWLPKSDYVLDDRPHFEIMGEKFKNEDPESEEEIWIPIKFK